MHVIKRWSYQRVHLLLCVIIFFMPCITLAQSTPVGFWRTYDLSHAPRSIIQITSRNGNLTGTIIKNLPGKNNATTHTCDACKGNWHGKPVVGLPIIWGLTQKNNRWESGSVLDVDSGKIYQCNLSVSEDNKTLHFLPYVGIPLLGVQLEWERVG